MTTLSSLSTTLSHQSHHPGTLDRERSVARLFFYLLLISLAGYALLGRGYAYLGVYPVYIGEIVLILGIIALIKSGKIKAILTTPVVPFIVVFEAWCLIRTVPYIGVYGSDVFRDAAIWAYSLFALALLAIVVNSPGLLRVIIQLYQKFAIYFLASAWILYIVYRMFGSAIPSILGSPVSIIYPKPGDMMVHLSAITAFLLIGMMRRNPIIITLLLINFGVLVAAKRAGMLAFLGAMIAITLMPQLRIRGVLYVLALAIVVISIIDPKIHIADSRPLSIQQVVSEATSMVNRSADGNLQNSKTWRIKWWQEIVHYTVMGEYFWTGKGFGVNLADDDGFQVLNNSELRSPHSGHMTFLARTGVPGFLLWIALLASYARLLLSRIKHSKLTGDHNWTKIFVFLLAYWVALLINASFDVFLEGPMGGIWFWSVIGTGLAGVYVYDHHPEVCRDSEKQILQSVQRKRP
jgi:O-Antigen ligase